MAIDTAAKRRSVAGLPFWLFGPGVTPDATPDSFWRQCVGWGYAGIAAAEGAVVAVVAAAAGVARRMKLVTSDPRRRRRVIR